MPEDATAGLGHNNPPAPIYDAEIVAKLKKSAEPLLKDLGQAMKEGALATQEEIGRAVDLQKAAKKLQRNIEAERKKAKEPHLEAGRLVDAAFNGIKDALGLGLKKLDPKLNDALKRVEAEQEEARQAAEAKIAEERAAAERQAEVAEAAGDLMSMAEAQDRQGEIDRAEAEAARAGPARLEGISGEHRPVSRRTYREAEITNVNLLFMHYREESAVAEVLKRLADRDIRSTSVDEKTIPGIKIVTRETIV
ncbi:MAG: hypothetical protein AAFQ51_05365 [Pseudomonadota bacterium]